MKIRNILIIAVLVFPATLAFGQSTSPAPVDLAYHFKAGTVLHYQRLDEIRNPDNPPGYQDGNFDTKDDIHITVEKVDSMDNATLVIQNEESHDFKGGDDANGVTMGGLAQDIPLYSVTVDRYGKFLSGKILHRSPQDSINQELRKNPKIIFSGPQSDSSDINFWMWQALCPRPTRSSVQIGTSWQDSMAQISHNHVFYFNQSATPAKEEPPPLPSYYAHHYNYKIAQDGADRAAGKYSLVTESMNYQVSEGKLLSQGIKNETQDIRSSDGITLKRTQFEKRVPGKSADTSFDNSYITRTLTLISIDSTQK
jgi:hypothetical protein